ncbi:MAG: hypothetical protein WC003_14220 [Terrimicrobiaceae bacterium]
MPLLRLRLRAIPRDSIRKRKPQSGICDNPVRRDCRAKLARFPTNGGGSPLHSIFHYLENDIAPYLNWHLARAGLDREIFSPAAIDLLAEASEGNPRTLNLLAQAAWLASARAGSSDIEPGHVHCALRQVPIGNAKIQNP